MKQHSNMDTMKIIEQTQNQTQQTRQTETQTLFQTLKTKFIKLTVIIGVSTMIFGCNGNTLDLYKKEEPKIDLEQFFTGKVKAWGIIQDWRGRVTLKFDVDMVGTWKDGVGTLDEKFEYYNGRVDKRIWTIKKTGDDTYEGTAGDIIGVAKGGSSGSALQWEYSMDVPVGDTTYRLKFDDWMWQMNDGVVINRSYMKKFGITVGELTLFMQKQK